MRNDENGGAQLPPDTPLDGRADASVVTQFFLLPLAVVAGLLGVFLLYTLATRRVPTARDYLETLRSGRFNQRWQAAFELSNLLKKKDASVGDPGMLSEMVKIFQESVTSPDEDPRVKRYLALALGDSASAQAIDPLLKAARGEDSETRLYALWGLAHLKAVEAKELFREGLTDADPTVRSICAFGLGVLSEHPDLTDVEPLLKDPVPDVRWNAALALARNGSASGESVLIELLDRKYLDAFPGLKSPDKTELILNALRGLKHLKTHGLSEKLRRLANADPDPNVRKAARSWDINDPS